MWFCKQLFSIFENLNSGPDTEQVMKRNRLGSPSVVLSWKIRQAEISGYNLAGLMSLKVCSLLEKKNFFLTVITFTNWNTIANLKSHLDIIFISFILLNKEGKTILYGSGTTLDSWFIKLWVVAKYPKIIFATYESEKKDKEIKICDTIIDSIQFIF